MTRKRRSVARRSLVIVVAVILTWLVAVGAVLLSGAVDGRRPADSIIVLGAAQYVGRPSPVLQARLDHGAELWREGLAPWMVLTGGVGTGDTTSEAAVGRRYLLARGIPDSAILLEGEGRTTGQSVRAAADLLKAQGLRSAILVSDPFHSARLRILAFRHGLNAVTSPTRTSPIGRSMRRQLRYVVSEALKLPVAMVFPNQ